MIANISPNNGSFGETQNTLHWANRAKEIRTKVSYCCEIPSSLVEHSSRYSSSYHVCKPLELSSTSQIRSVVVAT